MLKNLTACAALLVLGAASVNAQQPDLVLRKIDVPGATFEVVVVMPKASAPATIGLPGPESALLVHPTGDELAFATDAEIEKIFGSSRYLIHAFRVERRDRDPLSAVHVYIVSNAARAASD